MDTKWLEDFVSLAETRSFSRSAQLRHVTQPAFSRRIQALEAWAGTDLVDRSSYPTRLTPAGVTFHAQAMEIIESLQATRNLMRAHRSVGQDMIEFAVPHTLAFAFVPHWVMQLKRELGAGFASMKSRLIALNVHDAVLRLAEGSCDLLIAYHHPAQPLQLNTDRYEMLTLGEESLRAYARATPDGEPMFMLPAAGHHGGSGDRSRQRVPFLAYAAGAYLGQMVDLIVKQAATPLGLDAIYETDMAEGLKAMALEGHGLAFLPSSSVRKELKQRKLLPAAPSGSFELTMDVRIYRERPEVARHVKPIAQALWEHLRASLERPVAA
ncbi:MAG: LysR family transcriptional regulator [Burkholderiaceae bacterium]